MTQRYEGLKSRKVNIYVTDKEWTRWRVWLAGHNRSGSLTLSEFIRRVIGRPRRKRTKVLSSADGTRTKAKAQPGRE